MSKSNQMVLYIGIAISVFTITFSYRVLHGKPCCEQAFSDESKWITDCPPDDSTAGFGGLVWAKTRNGIQLRFSFTVEEGVDWMPLVAPAGTEDSKQAASLRALFGRRG